MLDAVGVHFTGQRESFDTDRLLATVLFTDLVRSTEAVMAAGDRRWQEILDEHDALVLRELKLHRGELVKSTGDGVLAVFDAPVRAIRGAQDVDVIVIADQNTGGIGIVCQTTGIVA